MKKTIGVIVFLVAVVVIALTQVDVESYATTTKNYDGKILEEAESILPQFGIEDENQYSSEYQKHYIVEERGSFYTISDYGEKDKIYIDDGLRVNYHQVSEVIDPSEDVISKTDEAKSLVKNYVESSTVLSRKSSIDRFLSMIEVKEAVFKNTDVNVFYSSKDNVLFCNVNEDVSMKSIISALIDAVRYYTHAVNDLDDAYSTTIFNEAMENAIAEAIVPEDTTGEVNNNSEYYPLVYPYIHIAGEDAIKAFFYGYGSFDYTKITKDELDLFAYSLGRKDLEVHPASKLISTWFCLY